MKQKFYSILLLVMAMLCTGANNAWAKDLDIAQVDWQNALAAINSACVENETTFTLTFTSSYTGSATGIEASPGINIYRDGETNNYIVAPTTAGDVIKPECGGLFINCTNLTAIDFTNFDTSRATNMSGMFSFCTSLTSLDLSSFDTSSVTDMNSMFQCCTSLTSLDLSSFNTSKVENMANMFDMENIDELTSSLVSITFGENFVTSNVTSMANMFDYCSSLTSLDLSNFNTSNVTTMQRMFDGCSSLQSLTLSNNFSTSKVENMYLMFYSCSSLTSLDLSRFNTSSVTIMESMFDGCGNLESLTLSSNFNTSSVTTMSGMFYCCEKLASLDLSSFDTSSVTDMWGMFSSCSNLTSLDLSSFDTSSVTDMSCMFNGCENLTSLDLSNFNTSKVLDMGYMFYDCSSLQSLTIGNFDMSSVYIDEEEDENSSEGMFTDCDNLTTLTIKSLPYLANSTFNTQFSGEGKTVNYELDEHSQVYIGTSYLPAATQAPNYTRDPANTWGTIVVPFEAKSDENVQLYELKSVTQLTDEPTGKMIFTPVETVAANTPCVFKKKDANASKVHIYASSAATPAVGTIEEPAAVDGFAIRGTYKALSNQTGIYFIAENQFWWAEDAITINPFRAWFKGPTTSANAPLRIVEADETEDIKLIPDANGTSYMVNGQCLDLQGRQTNSRKGLVVENGRVIFQR